MASFKYTNCTQYGDVRAGAALKAASLLAFLNLRKYSCLLQTIELYMYDISRGVFKDTRVVVFISNLL